MAYFDAGTTLSGEDVAKHLGVPSNPRFVALAEQHLRTVAQLVKAYTRGRGFDAAGYPEPAIDAVILTATARLTANPQNMITQSVNGANVRQAYFEGFTLVEQLTLNNYRRRTA